MKGSHVLLTCFTFSLSEVITQAPAGEPIHEAVYFEFLVRILIRSKKNSVEITAGEIVPDLLDYAEQLTDREWVTRSIDRDKVNADKVIDLILHESGWGWLNPLKKTGVLNVSVPLANGTMGSWRFSLMLTKNPVGKRQLRIER